MDRKRAVLVACVGTSPAVLTETVWALAHQTPPCVPDKVVVLTTSDGKSKLLECLCFENGAPGGKSPWTALAKSLSEKGVDVTGRLKLTEQTVKVFTGEDEKPLNDLRTRAENLRAADLMMKEIREYAEDEDWVVHAQLAGGRKTMSALLFSCMCLLGRPCDHVYHVLVGDGYDNPRLDPPFFFPRKGIVHRATDHGGNIMELPSSKAKVDLFDVPFVPMGEWAAQKCKGARKGLTYQNVIDSVNAEVEADVYPRIEIDLSGRGKIALNGSPVKKGTCFEFALFAFVAQGKCPRECLPLFRDLKDYLCLGDGVDEWLFEKYRWLEKFKGDETKKTGGGMFGRYDCQDERQREQKRSHDLTRALSDLGGHLPPTASMKRLLDRDSFPTDFDCGLVVWKGFEDLPPEILTRIFLHETQKRLGLMARHPG